MEKEKRECKYVRCNNTFETKNKRKVFCSRDCKTKNRQYNKYHNDPEYRKRKNKDNMFRYYYKKQLEK